MSQELGEPYRAQCPLSSLNLALCDLGPVTIPLRVTWLSSKRRRQGLHACHVLQAWLSLRSELWEAPPARGHGVWVWVFYRGSRAGGSAAALRPPVPAFGASGMVQRSQEQEGTHAGIVPGAGNPPAAGWLPRPTARLGNSLPSSLPSSLPPLPGQGSQAASC